MEPITRVAIIGAGRIVERIHLPILAGKPDLVVSCIAEPDRKRRKQLAARYPEYSYLAHADAVWEYHPDLVVIATPNCFHAKLAIQALRRNVSVWCEKPAAVSGAELRALQRAHDCSTAVLTISSPNRYRVETLALKELIDARTIGAVQRVHLSWLRAKGIPSVGSWFTTRALAGGGAAIDLGSHLFDVGFWLMRPPRVAEIKGALRYPSVESAQRTATWYYPAVDRADGKCDVEVAAAGEVTFEGGGKFSFETSWESDREHDVTTVMVEGTSGSARLRTLFGFAPTPMTSSTLEWSGQGRVRGSRRWPLELAKTPFERQWSVGLEAMRHRRFNRTGAARTLTATGALLKFYEHARRDTTPALSESANGPGCVGHGDALDPHPAARMTSFP